MFQVGVGSGIVISVFKCDLSKEIKSQQSLNEDQEISSHVSVRSLQFINKACSMNDYSKFIRTNLSTVMFFVQYLTRFYLKRSDVFI